MTAITRAVGIGFAVLAIGSSGCTTVAKIEEPAFTTQVHDGDFEVRRYGGRVVAKTEVEGDWESAGRSIGKTMHRRRVRRAHSPTHWAARTPGDAPFEGLDAVYGALSRRPWSLFGRSVMRCVDAPRPSAQ